MNITNVIYTMYQIEDDPNPGPAAYLPDYRLIHQKPPKFSLGQRTHMGSGAPTPAPNAYKLPTCIGCKIVDKYALPCYTM